MTRIQNGLESKTPLVSPGQHRAEAGCPRAGVPGHFSSPASVSDSVCSSQYNTSDTAATNVI